MKRITIIIFLPGILLNVWAGLSHAENRSESGRARAVRKTAEIAPVVPGQKSDRSLRRAPALNRKEAEAGSVDEAGDFSAKTRLRQKDKEYPLAAVRDCGAIRNPSARKACFNNAASPAKGEMKLADCSKVVGVLARKKCLSANKLAAKQSISARDLDPAARSKHSQRLLLEEKNREWKACIHNVRSACLDEFPEARQFGERRKCENALKEKCGHGPSRNSGKQ